MLGMSTESHPGMLPGYGPAKSILAQAGSHSRDGSSRAGAALPLQTHREQPLGTTPWLWGGPGSALTAQPLASAVHGGSRTGSWRQGNLRSPASALPSQEERQAGPDPAPADCRARRDGREDQRNSALGALLQEVLSPRQEHAQLMQPFRISALEKGHLHRPGSTGISQQPMTSERPPCVYLEGVYWGVPGLSDAETTQEPSPSIDLSAKNPLCSESSSCWEQQTGS